MITVLNITKLLKRNHQDQTKRRSGLGNMKKMYVSHDYGDFPWRKSPSQVGYHKLGFLGIFFLGLSTWEEVT